MPNKKRIKALHLVILLIVMLILLAACGNKKSSSPDGQMQESASEGEKSQATEDISAEDSSQNTEVKETEKKDVKKDIKEDVIEKEASITKAAPSTTGRLKVIGAQLCSESGNPIQLRGMSTHGLGWFPQFVNQEAFNEFHDEWGANVIRLAMYTGEGAGYCTGGNKTELKKLVENGVEYAKNADMYVIIDWHILSDNDPNQYKTEAISFFTEMSQKYADYNNVIYEICNEPNGGTSWSDIKAYANEVIPVIRANDPNAVIVVGTPCWSQEVDKAAADPIIGYDNIMYTLHYYAATHGDFLRDRMVEAIKEGLPIFVTEYGICDASGNGAIDEESANEWVRVMNDNNVSYICWNLSNKNETSAIFKESCTKTSGFTDEDLNPEGIWLRNVLRNAAGTGFSSSNKPNEKSSSPNTVSNQKQLEKSTTNNQKQPEQNTPSEVKSKSGNIIATAKLRQSWESSNGKCYLYDITVSNNSNENVSSWSVDIEWDKSFTVESSWNGNFTTEGNIMSIKNGDYNGQLEAGASCTDIGVIICK